MPSPCSRASACRGSTDRRVFHRRERHAGLQSDVVRLSRPGRWSGWTGAGREEAIQAPPRAYERLRLSPDGSTIALEARDQEDDIWLWHLARRTLTRLTFGRAQERAPVWTPDGRRIVFSSDRDGTPLLFWQPADGTGSVEQLTTTGQQVPDSVAADGVPFLYGIGERRRPPRYPDDAAAAAPTQGEAKPALTPLVKTDREEGRGRRLAGWPVAGLRVESIGCQSKVLVTPLPGRLGRPLAGVIGRGPKRAMVARLARAVLHRRRDADARQRSTRPGWTASVPDR